MKVWRPLRLVVAGIGGVTLMQAPAQGLVLDVQSLDGSGNNVAHPLWGIAGSRYSRVAPARYADGQSAMWDGPNSRYVSNRLFNDESHDEQGRPFVANVFSENQVSQWGWVWGQFVDHSLGLVLGREVGDPQGERADIPVNVADPLEREPFSPAAVPFTRSAPAPGSGVRQQINTVGSYLDASTVYGGTNQRLDWMRQGTVDGDPTNNSALMLLPDGYLPRRDARGDAATAPAMELGGKLATDPAGAVVTGDVRGNENILITAVQTLFAREHNRIVDLLPDSLSDEQKFQIARRVVISEIQYITYNEFLPAMGVHLPPYTGYDPRVDTALSTEFATTGFRLHSTVHGEILVETNASRYTDEDLKALRDEGIFPVISPDGSKASIAFELSRGLDNPALVQRLQLGPLLQGIALRAEYRNDPMVEIQLRSAVCSQPPTCLSDLAATDLSRSRDHGIPAYNALRAAYGLPPKRSFKAVTGEKSEDFPSDPELTPGNEINDPDSLDFLHLINLFGTDVGFNGDPATLNEPIISQQRAPVAARLKAIYGSVDNLEAYSGMVSEPHARGSELGELQTAMWLHEFRKLRDGDRFYYGNQLPVLQAVKKAYGIDFRRTLSEVIADNTDLTAADLPRNVFYTLGQQPPWSCRVSYKVTDQRSDGTFAARIRLTNAGSRPLDSWALRFRYLDGQVVTDTTGGVTAQRQTDVPITNVPGTVLAPGATQDITLKGTWTGKNPDPTRFTLNTTPCV